MSQPLWESDFHLAGGVVTDEIREKVYQIARTSSFSQSHVGEVLVSVFTAGRAERISRDLKRAAEALRKFGDACRAIQLNHQGKRKQGMRNSYGTKWGGQ